MSMKNITEYCKRYVYTGNIVERNERMFPPRGKFSKFTLWTGDHCRERQRQRGVTDGDIIDAFKGAWKQLNKLYREHRVRKSEDYGRDTHFIIIDARKDREQPVNIAAFVYDVHSDDTLSGASFTIKTVYRGATFTGTLHDDKNVEKIFLY